MRVLLFHSKNLGVLKTITQDCKVQKIETQQTSLTNTRSNKSKVLKEIKQSMKKNKTLLKHVHNAKLSRDEDS